MSYTDLDELVYSGNKDREPYPNDIDRMQSVAEHNGYSVSRSDLHDAWSYHSEIVCAGWLFLPDNDEDLWAALRPRLNNKGE